MQVLEKANVEVTTDNPRGGVNVHFDLRGRSPLQQSPVWSAAGRELQFFNLAPGVGLRVGTHRTYVKVILGRLENIDRGCLAGAFEVRSTRLHTEDVVAGGEGALIAVARLRDDAPERVVDMTDMVFDGPGCEQMVWQRFDEKFGAVTEFFNGQDCHVASGLHLLDEGGREIAYVNPWTCGKGVDLSTHNHGHPPSEMAPAFTEVHWVLSAAAADSGMYRAADASGAERQRFPMQLGDEHGPFYDRDSTGRPLFRENGAVQYPWHGWQGGDDGQAGQAYDFVAAFEINPDFIAARQ